MYTRTTNNNDDNNNIKNIIAENSSKNITDDYDKNVVTELSEVVAQEGNIPGVSTTTGSSLSITKLPLLKNTELPKPICDIGGRRPRSLSYGEHYYSTAPKWPKFRNEVKLEKLTSYFHLTVSTSKSANNLVNNNDNENHNDRIEIDNKHCDNNFEIITSDNGGDHHHQFDETTTDCPTNSADDNQLLASIDQDNYYCSNSEKQTYSMPEKKVGGILLVRKSSKLSRNDSSASGSSTSNSSNVPSSPSPRVSFDDTSVFFMSGIMRPRRISFHSVKWGSFRKKKHVSHNLLTAMASWRWNSFMESILPFLQKASRDQLANTSKDMCCIVRAESIHMKAGDIKCLTVLETFINLQYLDASDEKAAEPTIIHHSPIRKKKDQEIQLLCEKMDYLAEGSSWPSSLQSINLRGRQLGVKFAKSFASCISNGKISLKNLKELDLGNNCFGDEGTCAIIQALLSTVTSSTTEEGDNLKLQVLLLDHNSFGKTGVTVIANALMNGHFAGSLKILDLSGNDIGADGMKTLTETLTSRYCRASSLQKLSLNLSKISTEGAKHLSIALQSKHFCPKLSILEMKENRFNPEGARYIAEAIKSGSWPLKLKSIDISSNWIGDTGAEALAVALSTYWPDQLKFLHLGSNRIFDQGGKVLAEALSGVYMNKKKLNEEKNQKQRSVFVQSKYIPDIEVLDLKNNRIGAEGAVCIARALSHLQCSSPLKRLDLTSNWIGDNGGHAIAEALRGGIWLTHLENIDVEHNGMGPESEEEIKSALVMRKKSHSVA